MADTTSRPPRSFPAAAALLLRCPLCRGGLSATPGDSLRCPVGHSFDVARQGYVNLLPGDARPGTADTAEMVAARESFLASGHFAGLRGFICDAAEQAVGGAKNAGATNADARAGAEASVRGDAADGLDGRAADPARRWELGSGPGCIVEVGAGTGYYLAAVLDRLPREGGTGPRHLQVRGAPGRAGARAGRGRGLRCLGHPSRGRWLCRPGSRRLRSPQPD